MRAQIFLVIIFRFCVTHVHGKTVKIVRSNFSRLSVDGCEMTLLLRQDDEVVGVKASL
jgi:hypothetical protein